MSFWSYEYDELRGKQNSYPLPTRSCPSNISFGEFYSFELLSRVVFNSHKRPPHQQVIREGKGEGLHKEEIKGGKKGDGTTVWPQGSGLPEQEHRQRNWQAVDITQYQDQTIEGARNDVLPQGGSLPEEEAASREWHPGAIPGALEIAHHNQDVPQKPRQPSINNIEEKPVQSLIPTTQMNVDHKEPSHMAPIVTHAGSEGPNPFVIPKRWVLFQSFSRR